MAIFVEASVWWRTLSTYFLSSFIKFHSSIVVEKLKMCQPIRGQGSDHGLAPKQTWYKTLRSCFMSFLQNPFSGCREEKCFSQWEARAAIFDERLVRKLQEAKMGLISRTGGLSAMCNVFFKLSKQICSVKHFYTSAFRFKICTIAHYCCDISRVGNKQMPDCPCRTKNWPGKSIMTSASPRDKSFLTVRWYSFILEKHPFLEKLETGVHCKYSYFYSTENMLKS